MATNFFVAYDNFGQQNQFPLPIFPKNRHQYWNILEPNLWNFRRWKIGPFGYNIYCRLLGTYLATKRFVANDNIGQQNQFSSPMFPKQIGTSPEISWSLIVKNFGDEKWDLWVTKYFVAYYVCLNFKHHNSFISLVYFLLSLSLSLSFNQSLSQVIL